MGESKTENPKPAWMSGHSTVTDSCRTVTAQSQHRSAGSKQHPTWMLGLTISTRLSRGCDKKTNKTRVTGASTSDRGGRMGEPVSQHACMGVVNGCTDTAHAQHMYSTDTAQARRSMGVVNGCTDTDTACRASCKPIKTKRKISEPTRRVNKKGIWWVLHCLVLLRLQVRFSANIK